MKYTNKQKFKKFTTNCKRKKKTKTKKKKEAALNAHIGRSLLDAAILNSNSHREGILFY